MKRLATIFVLLACAVHAGPSFYGEALYWRPTGNDYDYAARIVTGRQEALTLKSDYDWGVRIGALWFDRGPCFAGDFYGLYARFLDVAHVDGGNLFLPLGNPTDQGSIRADSKIEHWAAGFRVRRYLHADSCLSFYLTAGARFGEINQWNRSQGAFPSFLQETLKFRGAGPEIGVGGSWNLWRWIDLKGAIYVTPLIGERKSRVRTETTRILSPSSTVIVPMLDARLALMVRRRHLGVEFGYEIDHYWNALIPPLGFVSGLTRRPVDAGFAGPYLQLSAGF